MQWIRGQFQIGCLWLTARIFCQQPEPCQPSTTMPDILSLPKPPRARRRGEGRGGGAVYNPLGSHRAQAIGSLLY